MNEYDPYRLGQYFKNSSKFSIIKMFLFKWYIIIIFPAVLGLFYFIKAVEENGLAAKIFNYTTDKMDLIVRVIKTCAIELPNVQNVISCVNYVN